MTPPLSSPISDGPRPAATVDFGRDRLQAQRSFLAVLGRASTRPAANEAPEDHARDAARQFVAQTLVLPILQQVREMDATPPPFAPGQGEKQFRALMDAELAQRITSSTRFPLVERVAQQLLKKGAKNSGQSAPAPAPIGRAFDPLSDLAGAVSGGIRPSFNPTSR